MDNYDKLYKRYQEASKNSEAKEFHAMDKVWTRLEDKLDAKVHKKQSKTWKKLAIAASVLLVVSLGYQWYRPNEIVNPQNETVDAEKHPLETLPPQIIPDRETVPKQTVVVTEKPNPVIRKDADGILKKQLEQETVGYQPKAEPSIMSGSVVVESAKAEEPEMDKSSTTSKKEKPSAFTNRIFEAKSVQKEETDDNGVSSFVPKSYAAKTAQTKSNPLVIIDGKAVNTDLKKLSEEELDSLILLPEPLYIINGTEYSEESLFGKNPTSPYWPLDQQEIESVTVIHVDEAVKTYGKKGEKGVVVITTKHGKPAKKK